MRTLSIHTSAPYDVRIGDGLLQQAGALLRDAFAPCRIAVIADSTVDALYGETVRQSLCDAGFDALRFAFPAGEAHKRLSTLETILEFLAANHFTRADMIAALGGGVTGDVAGFAAAVYLRGIRFVQMPTTLLAAVDSSVGGKTAVDLAVGKNLAGAFHQPSLVLTDTATLRTLPPHLLSDGAAEAIKCGVLADAALFDILSSTDWSKRLDEIVARSLDVKRRFVEADEFDAGLRRMLNLGHTFGHAIEKRSDYQMSHGQCVAVGTLLAAAADGRDELCRAIAAANLNCSLPTRCPYPASELAKAALNDKKRAGERIALVLPEAVGQCRIEDIPVEALEETFLRAAARLEALL